MVYLKFGQSATESIDWKRKTFNRKAATDTGIGIFGDYSGLIPDKAEKDMVVLVSRHTCQSEVVEQVLRNSQKFVLEIANE